MKKTAARLAAVFVIGIIVGGVLVTLHLGGTVDRITLENESMGQQLELCGDELDHLKKSMGERDKEVVSSIEPHVILSEENMSALEKNAVVLALDRQVRQCLEPVKGQEVKKLNHLLVPEIIDGRVFDVEKDRYRLKVKLIVLGAGLAVYVEAEKEKPDRPVVRPESGAGLVVPVQGRVI